MHQQSTQTTERRRARDTSTMHYNKTHHHRSNNNLFFFRALRARFNSTTNKIKNWVLLFLSFRIFFSCLGVVLGVRPRVGKRLKETRQKKDIFYRINTIYHHNSSIKSYSIIIYAHRRIIFLLFLLFIIIIIIYIIYFTMIL